MLYEQLLKEREEKEEILDNYNYEKSKFEQIIDLLQEQAQSHKKLAKIESHLNQSLPKNSIKKKVLKVDHIPFQVYSPNSPPETPFIQNTSPELTMQDLTPEYKKLTSDSHKQ
jgi:hypothetical protein